MLFTARVQRGPSEAARCASTEDHQAPSLPFHRGGSASKNSTRPLSACSRLACFSSKGSSRTVFHCAHRTSTVLSCAFCEQEGWFGYSLPPPLFAKNWKRFVKMRRTRASLRKDPGGLEDDWSQPYSTSTVMVWVAVARSWSFVAPVTVIL